MNWSAEDMRVAQLLGQNLGPIRVVEVVKHKEKHVTDVIDTTATEDTGWNGDETAPAVAYPELSDNPHNHTYTWSPKLPDGSMLVIRAQSAEALAEAAEALAGVTGRLRTAWQNATGTAPAAPQAPAPALQGPPPPGYGQGAMPQQYPPQFAPQAPGSAPAPWQNGGAPQGQFGGGGVQLPPGWYKLNVPFPQKGAFDGIVQQYNIQKGDPSRGGQVSFQKATKSWYCAGEVVQAFAQFSPVPANS